MICSVIILWWHEFKTLPSSLHLQHVACCKSVLRSNQTGFILKLSCIGDRTCLPLDINTNLFPYFSGCWAWKVRWSFVVHKRLQRFLNILSRWGLIKKCQKQSIKINMKVTPYSSSRIFKFIDLKRGEAGAWAWPCDEVVNNIFSNQLAISGHLDTLKV